MADTTGNVWAEREFPSPDRPDPHPTSTLPLPPQVRSPAKAFPHLAKRRLQASSDGASPQMLAAALLSSPRPAEPAASLSQDGPALPLAPTPSAADTEVNGSTHIGGSGAIVSPESKQAFRSFENGTPGKHTNRSTASADVSERRGSSSNGWDRVEAGVPTLANVSRTDLRVPPRAPVLSTDIRLQVPARKTSNSSSVSSVSRPHRVEIDDSLRRLGETETKASSSSPRSQPSLNYNSILETMSTGRAYRSALDDTAKTPRIQYAVLDEGVQTSDSLGPASLQEKTDTGLPKLQVPTSITTRVVSVNVEPTPARVSARQVSITTPDSDNSPVPLPANIQAGSEPASSAVVAPGLWLPPPAGTDEKSDLPASIMSDEAANIQKIASMPSVRALNAAAVADIDADILEVNGYAAGNVQGRHEFKKTSVLPDTAAMLPTFAPGSPFDLAMQAKITRRKRIHKPEALKRLQQGEEEFERRKQAKALGKIINKEHKQYQTSFGMMLGIYTSVVNTQFGSEKMVLDDFMRVRKLVFPPDGSKLTPHTPCPRRLNSRTTHRRYFTTCANDSPLTNNII
jgi:hypothetical protein